MPFQYKTRTKCKEFKLRYTGAGSIPDRTQCSIHKACTISTCGESDDQIPSLERDTLPNDTDVPKSQAHQRRVKYLLNKAIGKIKKGGILFRWDDLWQVRFEI